MLTSRQLKPRLAAERESDLALAAHDSLSKGTSAASMPQHVDFEESTC